MVFSSLIFIFGFLPAVLILYYLIPEEKLGWRNIVLLVFSILFYFYAEPKLILLLLASIVVNYIIGLLLNRSCNKTLLTLGVILNLGVLIYFNYTNFFIDNINNLGGHNIARLDIVMPLGLSFYTFQSISYLVDAYRDNSLIEGNLFKFALYIIMFPQLIAGPIVRYKDVKDQIDSRGHSIEKFSSGIDRFVFGLAKKVLISNTFAQIADYVFDQGMDLDNGSLAWLGAIAYTIQIYFDFSGYSDMAVGLGRMFGIDFLENFNYPYIATTVTDFWRRWHISLSSWFRDYVYIPLGGNRKGFYRQIFNMFVVWILTGFWHGASWNFIIWGLYYAVILAIEKQFFLNFFEKHKVIGHICTILLFTIGWLIFRATSFEQIAHMLKLMFTFKGGLHSDVVYYLIQYKYRFIAAILFSTPILRKIPRNKFTESVSIVVIAALMVLIVMSLLQNTYNPFIYFKF